MQASPQLFRTMGLKFTRIFLSSEKFDPEVKLWRAVVVNAIEDTNNPHSDRKNSLQKINAHNWITGKTKDFEKVCYWGKLDPDDVYDCYVNAIKLKKIYFNERQVQWHPYDKLYRKMSDCDPVSKKRIRKKLFEMRATINETSTAVCSTIFVSAFS